MTSEPDSVLEARPDAHPAIRREHDSPFGACIFAGIAPANESHPNASHGSGSTVCSPEYQTGARCRRYCLAMTSTDPEAGLWTFSDAETRLILDGRR